METSGIEIWEDLINTKIAPATLLNQPQNQETMDNYVSLSANAKNALRMFLMKQAFARPNETELDVLIGSFHVFLGLLMDNVYRYQNGKRLPSEIKSLYNTVLNDLQTGLQFIQHYFKRYFDIDAKAPDINIYLSRKEIDNSLQQLITTSEFSNNDQNLLNSAYTVITQILDGIVEPVSYRKLQYIKGLLTSIADIKNRSLTIGKYSKITALLIQMNFNDPSFETFLSDEITLSISKFETPAEKIEVLREYYKQTNQFQIRTGVALNIDQPSVKEMILAWLEEEITFWRSGEPSKSLLSESSALPKINTSFSVPSLALFIRLLKEVEIVTNPNHAKILRFFANYFTTQRKTDISYIHLHSKFYQIEESTKRKVYDLLLQMANVCKKLK